MKICIVGGGTAGWMSAVSFTTLLKDVAEEVTLIESSNNKPIGVGESTLYHITRWLESVGIHSDEFITRTNATFKHSIRFTNWLKKDSGSFHYPFGEKPPHSPQMWWAYYENPDQDLYKDYFSVFPTLNDYSTMINPIARVAEAGCINNHLEYAYHFDACKFADFLNERCGDSVKRIDANVVDCELNEDGIKTLKLDNGGEVEADLYVDCTGFKSQLLGEFLNEPFISFEHLLPNDRAIATHLPYRDKEKELVAYTDNIAYDNGWIWKIPLWDRMGSGYVYSSKYISDEDAKVEYINWLEEQGYDTSECEFKLIPMRVGRHERGYVKNVVAIGLSSGFIEPLESSGLFTVHNNLKDLYMILRRGEPSAILKEYYNKSISMNFDEFADFVAVHWAFTQRQDTPYWKDIFNKEYDLRGIENYERFGLTAFHQDLMQNGKYTHLDRGFHYISSSMGVRPYFKPHYDPPHIQEMLHTLAEWDKLIKDRLPSAYEHMNTYYEPLLEVAQENDKTESVDV